MKRKKSVLTTVIAPFKTLTVNTLEENSALDLFVKWISFKEEDHKYISLLGDVLIRIC